LKLIGWNNSKLALRWRRRSFRVVSGHVTGINVDVLGEKGVFLAIGRSWTIFALGQSPNLPYCHNDVVMFASR